jgi:hypothetical protein
MEERLEPMSMQVADPPKSRTMASVLWLMTGLFLGFMLLAAAVVMIEIIAGHGILGIGPSEKAALAENRRLLQEKDNAEKNQRDAEASQKASAQRIKTLEQDLADAKAKGNTDAKDPPADSDWLTDILTEFANAAQLQKEKKELKSKLEDKNKELAKAKDELKERDATIKDLNEKLAKANGSNPPKEDPKKIKPKDTDTKKDTPKNDTPSDLEEDNAQSALKRARDAIKNDDKKAAEKILKEIIDLHGKTKAAKEAKEELEKLNKNQ